MAAFAWIATECLALALTGHMAESAPPETLPSPEVTQHWLPAASLVAVLVMAGIVAAAIIARNHHARRAAALEQQLKARDAEFERLAREEQRLERDAAASNRARTAFLANVSHELRTPMNAVLGMNGLLLDTPLTPQQRELAEAVQTGGEALLTIVNDLLDLSRIEYGKLAIEETDLHLRQVVESAVEMAACRAHEKGIELICLIHRDIPSHLRGDPGRIRQVLLNLVGNAVKFTERGEVVVEARLQSETPEAAEIRVDVRDTGIGIAPSTLATLFQPFCQGDSSPSRRFGGAGVGLAISERLVELMGGEIGASSRIAEGSTFWFTLRLARMSAAVEEPLPTWLQRFAGSQVLVADHSAASRRILTHHLEAWGLRNGIHGNSGIEVLSSLRKARTEGTPIPLVLIDHTLADMDGSQLARQIRADPDLHETRLVLLTPLAMQVHAEQLRRAGFDAWVTKPIRQSHLFNALHQALAPNRGAPLGLSPVAPQVIGPVGADLAGLRVLVAEDNPPNQVFARRLMLRLGFEATIVGDGREVLESLDQNQYDLVLMDCHMPGLDGFEATRRIRSSGEAWADIPIIAVTADAIAGTREACLEAGMNDYVSKPLKHEELLKAMRRVRSKDAVASANMRVELPVTSGTFSYTAPTQKIKSTNAVT